VTTRLKLVKSSVPEFMIERGHQWMIWEHVENNEKVPLDLASIRRKVSAHEEGRRPEPVLYGSANDLKNFTTYADACRLAAYLRKAKAMQAGIGYALTGDDRIVAFDFDDVLDDQGNFIDKRIEAVVRRLGTYTEISPGGYGVHCFVLVSVATKAMLLALIPSWCSFSDKPGRCLQAHGLRGQGIRDGHRQAARRLFTTGQHEGGSLFIGVAKVEPPRRAHAD
jgi:hypothetical protein